jgi:polysaccharide export outer membrane protein
MRKCLSIAICALTILLSLILPLSAAQPEATRDQQNAAAGKAPGGDYLIGPGDVLEISVWKDANLTRTVVVLPDGKLSFPLIGEVVVAGRTVEDLRKEMAPRLARYTSDMVLSIEVKQVNSLIVYVIGRVNAPGRFVLNANLNVLQVLSAAGGLNTFAKRGKVRIFRQEGGKTLTFPFDYDEVTEGSHLEQNILLKRGDVIVVP